MTERQTWDRREDETSAQFQAFRIYRDLGPVRTLEKAWKEYASQRGLSSSMSSSFKDWSRFNDWVARCRAFDGAQDAIRQEIRRAARDEARQIAAENAADIVRNLARLASGLRIDLEEAYEADRISEQYIIQAAKLLLDIADVKSPTRLEVGGKALVLQSRLEEVEADEAESLVSQFMQLAGTE